MKELLYPDDNTVSIKIVGTTFRPAGDIERVHGWLKSNQSITVKLKPEPDNPYDGNAIAVLCNDTHLGYIPKSVNKNLLPILDKTDHLLSLQLICGCKDNINDSYRLIIESKG